MSTVATEVMDAFAAKWATLYKSAKISGIVGDLAHRKRGGYHISREDNPADNYSVTRPDDQFGPKDAASAVDMTMDRADMITCTRRLVAAYTNVSDPRRKYLNAVNGWDGSGEAARYDFYALKSKYASSDHKWHVHLEVRRRYCNSPVAMDAILSILSGETVEHYLARIGVAKPAPKMVAVAAKKVIAPPWPGKVYSRNDKMKPDPNLAKWQARMIARGWTSIGKADGVFGARTEAIVRKFQALCRVTPDGEIGRVTWPLPWTRPTGS